MENSGLENLNVRSKYPRILSPSFQFWVQCGMESSDSEWRNLRKYKIPHEKHVCPICFWNDIGNEKHYSFHCTNPKLVEICKTFIGLIMYETFTPFPDINSVNDVLRIILRGSPRMNYNRIGKFLSSVLVKTQHLLLRYKLKLSVAAYIFSLCELFG